jgi:hypothetical protein
MAQVIGYLVLAAVAAAITVWLRRATAADSTPFSVRARGLKVIIGTPKVLPFAQSIDAPKVLRVKR